jgi:hypothetical protein
MGRLLKWFGLLGVHASNMVFGPMQWAPGRKLARRACDMLRLHGEVTAGVDERFDLEQAHGSICMESRMARISATSSRGEAGDQFASIIRRVLSTSRI